MKNFLLKFLGAEKTAEIERLFIEKNPDSKELPTYISKTRLDEEITKRKNAEAETETVRKSLKDIPEDWSKQLQDAKDALTTQKNDYEMKLAKANEAADVAAKIYGAGARNYKAVRALIDDSKPIDEQLTALKESDPYLFSRAKSSIGKGTGKGDEDHGGDGDEGGADKEHKLSEDDMFRAVGISRS